MTLGGESQGDNNKVVYSLKLVSEPGETEVRPVFVEKGTKEEGYALTDRKHSKVSGVLKVLKTTHNGKTGMKEVRGFKLCLEDGDEVYWIETTITNASKDILNKCLEARDKYIQIGLYLNDRKYPSSSVKDEEGKHIEGRIPFDPTKPLDAKKVWDILKSEEMANEENVENPF